MGNGPEKGAIGSDKSRKRKRLRKIWLLGSKYKFQKYPRARCHFFVGAWVQPLTGPSPLLYMRKKKRDADYFRKCSSCINCLRGENTWLNAENYLLAFSVRNPLTQKFKYSFDSKHTISSHIEIKCNLFYIWTTILLNFGS